MTRIRRSGVLAVVAMLALWGGAAAAAQAPAPATADEPVAAAAAAQAQEQNATVTFEDGTANGTTVTVANVTLPEGGYVAIHDSSLLDGDALGSVVGVSDYLEPGTHENVTVTLYEGVPGADFSNASAPNGTETFIAMPHMETSAPANGNQTNGDATDGNATDGDATDGNATNGDATDGNATDGNATDGNAMAQERTYDFVATNGSEDGPYTVDGEPVVDDADVTFEGEEPTEPPAEQPTRGFVVEGIDAPATVEAGENVTVTASVENTADETRTEQVAFRLEGEGLDLVITREVALDPGVSTTVTFDLDGSVLTAGQYIHGVTTANSSSFALLNVTAAGDTPSENAPGNDTAGPGDDAGEPGDGASEQNGNASDAAQVTFDDQASDGFRVTVDSVTLPEGGYVTVHDSGLLDGDVRGSLIGVSAPLGPGTYENLTITLFVVPAGNYDRIRLQESETLVAMPHVESDDNDFFGYLRSDGEQDDPYLVDGEPVTDQARVTIADGATDEPTTGTPGDDTATNGTTTDTPENDTG